jgi:hypothetical protein
LPVRAAVRDRYSFANLDEALELPDLIAIQRASFDWFLQQGLSETFRDISPIKDFTETLQLELEFDPNDEDLRPLPKFTVEECKEKDMTYAAPIFVRARFMNASTGEIKEQTVFMGDFPMMTDKGTFIINGTERVVVSHRVRRRAEAGQGRHRRLPRRPQAPPQHLRAAAGARLRRGELPRLPRQAGQLLQLPRGPVGEGSRAGADPGGGAGRDLQARPPG